MSEIGFITTNPGTDAYQKGVAADDRDTAAELAARGAIVNNAVNLAAAPSKLRNITATADKAVTDADLAAKTEGSSISKAASDAGLAGSNAAVGAGTVGSRISKSNSDAAVASNDAAVSTATVPTKIEVAKTGLRQQNATALNTEMNAFYKSLEMINAGDIEGGKAVSAAVGHPIPDAVIQSADLRNAVTTAAARAKEIYPDRPKDQQTYIASRIQAFTEAKAAGQPASDPMAAYALPAGAPEPPEEKRQDTHSYQLLPGKGPDDKGAMVDGVYTFDAGTGQKTFEPGVGVSARSGAGAGGHKSVFELKQAAWTAVHPGDTQGALDYAAGKKTMSEQDIAKTSLAMARSEASGNVMLSFDTAKKTAFVQQRAIEIAGQLRAGFLPGAPGGPAAPVPVVVPPPAPGVPPAPVAVAPPPGAGTQEQPYTATTQDHVNWFKQNAQPGDVISIDGQLYTK